MKRNSTCGKPTAILFFIVLCTTIPGMLSAQKFRAEGTAGFNLFSLSDPVMSAEVGEVELESDLTFKTFLFLGAYAGYKLGSMEVGAEFQFTDGRGETANIQVAGETLSESAGDFDYSFFKAGPVFRYFINSSNPKLKPFAGAALDYVKATVTIDNELNNLKFNQAYMDIGIFGGANYYIKDNLYLGFLGRVDSFMTTEDDEITGVNFGEVFTDVSKITTDGWAPFSIFVSIGGIF